MKEKYNFKLDLLNQSVSIKVSSAIFPAVVILRAAYHFIDEAKVIVGQDKKDKVLITFIPEKKPLKESDLEELAYEFNIQLISSFVEEEESRKHAGLREIMMKSALLPQAQIPLQGRPSSEKPAKTKKNRSEA